MFVKKKWIRKALAFTLLITLISCKKSPAAEEPVSPEPEKQRAVVTREKIEESVTVSGNIAPCQSRELGFSSDGKIMEIYVEEGEKAPKGEVLARIDTSRDEYAIEAKKYELEQLSYTESERKIALVRRELAALEEALKNKVITAPFDGIAAEIKKQVGEISRTSLGGDYLIKFIDPSRLKARVTIDELDIARIRLNQKGIFHFDALPGESFEGRVSKIARIGRLNNNGLPVVDVELIIDDPDPRIFIPYSFKAEIQTAEPRDVLLVPDAAVIWEDDQTYAEILKEEGKAPLKRQIKINPWKDGKSIVLEGLKEGDTLRIQTALPEGGGLWR